MSLLINFEDLQMKTSIKIFFMISLGFAVSIHAESDREVITNDDGKVIQEISYGGEADGKSIIETTFYTYSVTGGVVEKRTVNKEGDVVDIERY